MRYSFLFLATCVALRVYVLPAAAQETDPGRAPTGVITRPGDLLKEADGTEFRFAYFPSSDQLRLLVLQKTPAFTRWDVALRRKGDDRVLSRYDGALPMPAAGETVSVPTLDEGVYELTLNLTTPDGKQRDITRTFTRKHFPWENSALGSERIVIPPFTSMTVDKKRASVSCVLRTHDIDSNGLWKQVTSQGVPLLEAPMRLEIESAGKDYTAQGGKVTFTEKAADRVQGHASWHAGPVRGRTDFSVEYDGMAKLSLRLEPAQERVDALRLVIPLRTSETWLMHPVADLLRFHYAGRIPDGAGILWEYSGKTNTVRYTEAGKPDADGKVWDSRHVGRHKLPAPFVPYIWLGGTERGICWFAENDRDWNLDPQRPALEIRRQGETTSLVVHLFTRPTSLTRPRTLIFGLMATPAKPMPETPVNFRRWFPGAQVTNTEQVVNFGFMGACYYWGAAGPSFAFYPAFKNFSVYDEFVRLRKGGTADFAFTENWLKQFQSAEFTSRLDEHGHPPNIVTYRNHINWSLRFFNKGAWSSQPEKGRTGWVIPYTNARAINWGEEAETFMDEWSTMDIADPRWPGEERFIRGKDSICRLARYGKVSIPGETAGIAYAIDPLPSWQNMVLHYLKRMMETFADGIYFDDFFLSPNYTPTGPGYVAEDGTLRPGVNIFGFRELARRTAVMQHQMGRRPLLFIHMTNANLIPLLSFGTIILDHEWRDQGAFKDKDCQERLYLDGDTSLLLAQSTGLQSGCLSVWHNLFHGDERITRSALGVSLTHEIKCGLWYGPLHARTTALLANFGYGLPDCRVWRYWDADQPVKTEGAPVKTIVMARAGRALLAVSSYGPGGDVSLSLDLAALGVPADAVARNAEIGEPIERTAEGRFKLSLPRHDFRLIEVGPGQ
ncbi:MAG TPA: DUF6067 family protein [Kiritimatiellia bacterium]|nr:DUF6067 family protein [Kiritimatiellia bacterium]